VQENKAHKKEQNSDAHKNDIREYRTRKRRTITNESDDDVAVRTQQIQKERKLVKKNKFQRLNRFESLNYDINPKDNTSINNIREKDITLMQRKKF
jgi:hypothetical protein